MYKINYQLSFNRILYIFGAIVAILVIIFIFWWNKEIVITREGNSATKTKSSISGLECGDGSRRPIAVMLAGDPETRPLSGIGEADIVFEMPVAPNGITRFMAVFQCSNPKEIGSIRSAREDFIPLVGGLKAVYAHWGGEHRVLSELNSGILNNIDALKYETTAFYRKKGIKSPHNGFTDLGLLMDMAKTLKYDMVDSFEGYPHTDKIKDKNISNLASSISVNYPAPFGSSWIYDEASVSYRRGRSGQPEIDKNTDSQVQASVVILMQTKSTFLRDQYINVDTKGEGTAKIYQGGLVTEGIWKKDPQKLDSKLTFLNSKGEEIKFLPGKIWVQIVTN